MRRKLFNLVAALSLMLCIFTCGAWVRSYWRMRHFACSHDQRTVAVLSTLGRVAIFLNDDDSPNTYPSGFSWRSGSSPPLPMSRAFPGRGDEWWKFDGYVAPTRCVLIIPAWAVAVTTALLPIVWLLRRRALHRRRAEGRCPTCGYDCRGPADGSWKPDRCPECGNRVMIAE